MKNQCKSCKFWNTDRVEFHNVNKGWGYCTNGKIRTSLAATEWSTNNELNPSQDSIISSDFKGFLTEENSKKGIFGIFQTGQNFGCIHHLESQNNELPENN